MEKPVPRAKSEPEHSLSEPTLATLLRSGAALFDAGKHWHAHEAWETAWHGAPEQERDFFQGLVHCAAALVHHANGNAEGLRLQKDKMHRRLGPYGTHRGIDTQALIAAIDGLPPPGTPVQYPRIPWT